jgi:hypothetical protein
MLMRIQKDFYGKNDQYGNARSRTEVCVHGLSTKL